MPTDPSSSKRRGAASVCELGTPTRPNLVLEVECFDHLIFLSDFIKLVLKFLVLSCVHVSICSQTFSAVWSHASLLGSGLLSAWTGGVNS